MYCFSYAQIIPIHHDMKNLKVGNIFLYRDVSINFRTNEARTNYFYNRIIRFDTIAGKQYAVYQNGSKERADSSGVYWIPQSLDTTKPFMREYLKYPLFPEFSEKRFGLLNCSFLSSLSCSYEVDPRLIIDSALITALPGIYMIFGLNVRNFFFSKYSVGNYVTILGVMSETRNSGNTTIRRNLCGAFIEGKYYGDSACLVASSTPLQGAEFTTLTASLAPNPVSDIATVRFILPTAQGLTVEICDMLGREVAPPLVFDALSSGMNALPIDVSSIPRGVYAVRLRTALGLRATTLLVKE
jgi:hypothetical protein